MIDYSVNPITRTLTDGFQKTQMVDASGEGIDIFNTYPTGNEYGIPVKSVDGLLGLVDSGNSTSTPLAAGGTFTGTALDTLPYGSIYLQVYSNVPSAINGMSCQWSPNGTTWDTQRQFSVPTSTWINFTHSPHGRYFRVTYTNGATSQTTFYIQTVKTKTPLTGEIIPVDAAPVSGCDALLTKSVIAGKTTAGGGSYVDVKVNPSGALAVEAALAASSTVSVANFPATYATTANQTNGSQLTQIVGNTTTAAAEVWTGPNFGSKGLRVYIGPTDPIGDLPVVMNYDHHQIHEGETFRWSVYTNSLALNNSKDLRFVVPAISLPAGYTYVQRCPHFRFEVISSADASVYLYESATFTTGGTQRTPIALERNGTYTPKLQIWEDPTISAVGNLIWQGLLTATKSAAGSIDVSSNEFVLKNDTQYLFRVTSGASSNKVLERFLFYEDLGV